MAERVPKENCTNHTIEINNLKKDMESIKNHELKFNQTIERVENSIDMIERSVIKIDLALEHFKDIPDKVRKLEDKSLVFSLIEKGLWFIIGVAISIMIQQNYIATKERNEYKIEKIR